MSGWDDSPQLVSRREEIARALKTVDATIDEISSTSKRYNGWTNYETWAVALWIDNEYDSYRHWDNEAKFQLSEDGYLANKNRFSGVLANDRRALARSVMAEALKESFEEANPLNEIGTAGPFHDLLNGALSEVNWHEIADHYLDAIGEEARP